ncbi:MAG: type II toxin-antitoxin system Phd/YefM family antitoxin [Acidimicrobiales bacterium]
MTKSLGVHGAKAHLSQLLDDVAAGERVVIIRRGAPTALRVSLPMGANSAVRSGHAAHL